MRRIKAEIGTVKLSKLTAHQLDRMYANLMAGGMSPATIKMHHSILSSALHQAVKWDLVSRGATDNPPRVADCPTPKSRTRFSCRTGRPRRT